MSKGIFGSTKGYTPEVLQKKIDQLKYRGQEQVLDMQSSEVVAVVDGAFYNHSEENTLVNLYRQYGQDCLRHLNGDFAFVIYDPAKQLLFGAIDRMGNKPMYYSDDRGFEFCSHLTPICIGNGYEVDPSLRQYYFAMQYVPAPNTLFREVKKMRPGECFTYNLETKELKLALYWDLHDNTNDFTIPKTYEEALAKSEELLLDAIKVRMDTPEKKGVFLSGGIDSSLIAKYVHAMDSSIESFSIGFDVDSFDESYYFIEVAKRLGIRNNKYTFTVEDAKRILEDLPYYFDEPIGDASALPTSFLCEQVAAQVPVSLGGEGGDDTFFGQLRYVNYGNRQWIYRIPRPVRLIAASAADAMGKKREALSLRMDDIQSLYCNRRKHYPAELFDAVALEKSMEQNRYLYNTKEVIRGFNDYDFKTILSNELNEKTDRASSRARLDTRSPLVDYRLVEYTRMMPTEYLYNKEVGQKRILRDLLYRDLPRELFERRKRGFGVPTSRWFRKELKDFLIDVINPDSVAHLSEYDTKALIRMRDDHISGAAEYSALLWLLVTYIEWERMYKKL